MKNITRKFTRTTNNKKHMGHTALRLLLVTIVLMSACNRSHGLFRRFETPGVPTFVVVSKEGIILDVWTGHQHGKLIERINEALKK